jgi:CHAT domain-containing protein
VDDHEIVNLPSVSVLDQLRRDLTARPRASKSLIVFADPVYSLNDERFKLLPSQAANQESGSATMVARNLELSELKALNERLPATGEEAKQITNLTPPVYSKILGFDASVATLTKTDLSEYRILHFATHGWLNSQNPELSGVVLSLYDQKRSAQDGFLRSHEIYNLKLNADLVVLSACQTAIGKNVKGEGLMGLGRAFMYAGSTRVVVTLWKVDDVPTAELMRLFYTEMMVRKKSPAAALRAAQVTMSRHRKWSAPKNWAGFVLQGEWR